SATSGTVNENLGIRRKGLNNPPEAFQLIQRRRLAFPYRQNVTLPACSLSASATLYRGCCCSSSSNEIITANPWARRSSSSLSIGFAEANTQPLWIHQSFKLPLSSIYLTAVLLKLDLRVIVDFGVSNRFTQRN